MFPSAAPRGNIEILGKQNELFPSGPVIKFNVFSSTGHSVCACATLRSLMSVSAGPP